MLFGKLILLLMGIGAIVYVIQSIKNGTIHVKGYYYDKQREPLKFWFGSLVIFLFGIMLIYFGIFAKLAK